MGRVYLRPLAAALGERCGWHRGVGVARRGRDRVVDAGRDTEPLSVHVRRRRHRGPHHRPGGDRRLGHLGHARTRSAATGCPRSASAPPPTGSSYRSRTSTDPAVRARYAGKHIVVAGSGHSALTALVALAGLAEQDPGTRISWVLRRGEVGTAFGGGEDDQLPARGALGLRAAGGGRRRLLDGGHRVPHRGRRTATATGR